jgi:DNA polymerase-1
LAYAAYDALLPLRLHAALAAKLADAGLTATADLEHKTLPAVAWMAGHGVAFDRDGWLSLADQARSEAERLEPGLHALAPERFTKDSVYPVAWNFASAAQVKRLLAGLGIEVKSTGDAALADIDHPHPIVPLLREYRAATKRATTYGEDWLKAGYADGRVYASWWQCGAQSGRMSCSAPNLQNLPRDPAYRRCFVAPPGRVLIKGDFSQIELRIAAKVAGEWAMIRAYQRGDDLHTLTARRLLGRQDVSKADRQLAKAINFGLLFGMGAKRLRLYARASFGVELTPEEAGQYWQAFFDAYPVLRRWHKQAARTGEQPIDTRTRGGRRRLGVTRYTEKLNTPVQGTAADGVKKALALLWQRRGECPGAVPVLAVHDEIVVEVDADKADAAAAWLKRAMVEGMAPLVAPVPVEVEVTVAPTWAG